MIREAAMQNPTIVVLTDRNDLDDQLFGTFARCHDLLRNSGSGVTIDLLEPVASLEVMEGSAVFPP